MNEFKEVHFRCMRCKATKKQSYHKDDNIFLVDHIMNAQKKLYCNNCKAVRWEVIRK